MLLPSKFIPQTPADFIGPAARVAARMMRFVDHSRETGDGIGMLLTGPPGTGKTSLGRMLGIQLGITGSFLDEINAAKLTVDEMDKIEYNLHFRNMFFKWHFIFIDEFDSMPSVSKVRMLTLMNRVPRWTAIVATSNRATDELAQRNHSRFNAFEVTSPDAAEIIDFLDRKWQVPRATTAAAVQCASHQEGLFTVIDVRQVLKDCDEVILMGGELKQAA